MDPISCSKLASGSPCTRAGGVVSFPADSSSFRYRKEPECGGWRHLVRRRSVGFFERTSVSNIRLAAMLASLHGDSIAKMVHSALSTESKIWGADDWSGVEFQSAEHELATLARTEQGLPIEQDETKQEEKDKDQASEDPFAATLSIVLSGLEVTTLPPPAAIESTHIGVEGFEGINQAWGGGLDASEFVDSKKVAKPEGLGRLELLGTNDTPSTKPATRPDTPLEYLVVKKPGMKGPEMYISEVINAEFRESLIARVGLMGVVYLKTLLPDPLMMQKPSFLSRLKIQMVLKDLLCIMRVFLPRATPLPLRVRLVKRHNGTLLSVMIQYVSNPDLPAPLTDVTFTLKLPVDPRLLKVSPKAVLNRSERELQWQVDEIPLKGNPVRLRARMPVDTNEEDDVEEIEVVGYVKFSYQGTRSLSGISLQPVSEGKTDFYEVPHRYESGVYACN
ncbi:hypothetical protein L1987_14366 [Smallanthus sonchifolius]|uniref:Uncharacterized protein n=1 Tax=Smallanthus sonchifolius TaxID=185202 RepID=A0ACB9J640_9ASTR|nr:hypothetical protein L1987_14366 [Smallanthus sonchifolius]